MVQTDEKATKIISFAGMERCDLLYYFAKILNGMHFRTLITDNSLSHDLYRCIHKVEGETVGRVKDISIIENIAYSEEFFKRFEYVIVYHGNLIDKELYNRSDYKVLEVKYSPIFTIDFRKELENIEDFSKTLIVLRDNIGSKITADKVIRDLGINKKKLDEDLSPYELALDAKNIGMYQSLLYNGTQSNKYLPADVKEVLAQLTSVTCGIPLKQAKKEVNLTK